MRKITDLLPNSTEWDKYEKNQFNQLMSSLPEKTTNNIEEFAVELKRDLYEGTIRNRFAVFCLSKSKKPNNLLMWSHYADNHKGVAIEFDFPQEILSKSIGEKIHPICYKKKRPEKYLYNLTLKDWFTYKAKEWKYENEQRLILSLKNIEDYKHLSFKNPNELLLKLPITPSSIKSITFGCNYHSYYSHPDDRTHEQEKRYMNDKRTLLSILQSEKFQQGYAHVQYYSAKKDKANYSLIFEDLAREFSKQWKQEQWILS